MLTGLAGLHDHRTAPMQIDTHDLPPVVPCPQRACIVVIDT
jgi:hypothetical protein